jgi:hypothetical protein
MCNGYIEVICSSYLEHNKLYQLYIKLHMYPMNIHIKFVFGNVYGIYNVHITCVSKVYIIKVNFDTTLLVSVY